MSNTDPKKEVKTQKYFYDYQEKYAASALGKNGNPTELSDHVAVIDMLNAHALELAELREKIEKLEQQPKIMYSHGI